jgi:hypothetical protein
MNNILYKCKNYKHNKLYLTKDKFTDSYILFIFSIIHNDNITSITVYLDGSYKRHSDNIIKKIDEISFDNILKFIRRDNNYIHKMNKQSKYDKNLLYYVIHLPKDKLIIREDYIPYLDDCSKHIIQILINYIEKHTLTNKYYY